MEKFKHKNTLTIVLFFTYLLLLIWIVLFKLHFSFADMDKVRNISIIPFQGFGANEVYNILFFIPFGIYMCMLKNEWPFILKVILILCVSLSFEILQFILSIGRSDVTDLICNTLGGMVGIGIYGLIHKVLKDKTNRVMNIVLLGLTVIIVLFFVLLVTHSLHLIINL